MKIISIIIPAYNAGKYLSATIDSVIAQTFQDWELIIVDDGSQDETATIAKEYASKDDRLRVITHSNQGVAKTRSAGLQHSSPYTENVIFLDADDVWEPNALEILLHAIGNHPEAAGAHGWARYINSNDQLIQSPDLDRMTRQRLTAIEKGNRRWKVERRPLEEYTTFPMLAVQNCIITPGAVLLRRTALAETEPFDSATTPCEDWDMWLRLSRDRPFVFVNLPVIRYRYHWSGASRSQERMQKAHVSVVQKALAWPSNTEGQYHAIQTGLRYSAMAACLNRLEWAKGCWQQRQFFQAAKQVRHAVRSYAAYLTD